jgi:hypothetical protein
MFMDDIEAVIKPFIPSLNRGIAVEELLIPIMGENPSLNESAVKKALLSHLEPTVTHKSNVGGLNPTIQTSRYSDLPRRQYLKVVQFLTDIVQTVDKSAEGITKTGILQALGKDGSYWRPKITRWLHHLCEDGVIQTDNNRLNPQYFPHDAYVHNREREVHRRIIESLQIHGQMTMTQLAINIGRNGGSNRSQVFHALEDLESEGFVRIGQRNRWACVL